MGVQGVLVMSGVMVMVVSLLLVGVFVYETVICIYVGIDDGFGVMMRYHNHTNHYTRSTE